MTRSRGYRQKPGPSASQTPLQCGAGHPHGTEVWAAPEMPELGRLSHLPPGGREKDRERDRKIKRQNEIGREKR